MSALALPRRRTWASWGDFKACGFKELGVCHELTSVEDTPNRDCSIHIGCHSFDNPHLFPNSEHARGL